MTALKTTVAAGLAALTFAATQAAPASAAQTHVQRFNAGGGDQIESSRGSSRDTPKQRRWVCGPIVNWDGSPHCHWVP